MSPNATTTTNKRMASKIEMGMRCGWSQNEEHANE